MSKEQFTREILHQNIMREVIFRIDYTGVLSIEDLVKAFTRKFKGTFSKYSKTLHNRIDLGNIQIEQISESLSIPVKELQRQDIHRFSENLFGSDELVFDITNYYSVLHIKCTDYKTINPYLDFFTQYLDFLVESNEFISFKRFGLRKIGADVLENLDEVFGSFEPVYFYNNISSDLLKSTGTLFVDQLVSNDSLFNFTYRRVLEKGFLQNGEEIKDAFQVVLDLDGYMVEENIKKSEFEKAGTSKNLIQKLNDVYLFEMFKMSVTRSFLEKNSQ